MDGDASEERDAALVLDTHQDLSPTAVQHEKKNLFWLSGVLECFSSVLAVFGRTDSKPTEDDWEVPFESITDLVYLGSGAQGVVFSGNLRGEMVAVKKLRSRSETNIKHLRKLNHENIVRFRGVCTSAAGAGAGAGAAPSYCVVMEYCQYGPLFEFLHSGARFQPAQTLKWAREIAYGMAYLHNHKIIHRDLKSPNILIADNLVVKVSDFGTCRQWNEVSTIMSFTGTVAWMAPEVIRHEPCSERVDVWSFGVVLWELVTLEVPYRSMEAHAVMWGVGTDSVALPVPPACPPALRLLMRQCWSRVPRNRPPFKIIAAQLELASAEVEKEGLAALEGWRREPAAHTDTDTDTHTHTDTGTEQFRVRSPAQQQQQQQQQQAGGARSVAEARLVYEQQLGRANELYLEVCAVRLQLEQRERALAEREKALKWCRCGIRRNLKSYQRVSSSSSDNPRRPAPPHACLERRLNNNPPELELEHEHEHGHGHELEQNGNVPTRLHSRRYEHGRHPPDAAHV